MADLLQSYFPNVKLNVGDKLQTFYRLLLNEEVFFSQMYSRVKKRNSFTVLFSIHGKYNFGSILRYFVISGIPVAVIKYFKVVCQAAGHRFGINIPCVHSVQESDIHFVVPVHDIKEKCIFLEVSNCMYIARFPSKFLSD